MNHCIQLFCEACQETEEITVIAPPNYHIKARHYRNPMGSYEHVCEACAEYYEEEEDAA